MRTLQWNSRMSRASAFWAGIFTLGLGSFGFPLEAKAEPEFPGHVRDHLELACTPQCMLCHTTNTNPNAGNVRGPGSFPSALKTALGADFDDEDTLTQALDALLAAPADSDGDLMDDISELKDNNSETAAPGTAVHLARDPNVSGVGEICASEVGYGCGSRLARGPELPRSFESLMGVALLGVAALSAQRRTARARPTR
jgi:hypothetical protein